MDRHALFRAGLDVLHYSGIARLAARFFSGCGAIFMLHHVRPRPSRGFAPNAGLEVTPEFLDDAIRFVKARGYALMALDDLVALWEAGETEPERPVAIFTLDDGYRDNADYALEIFRKHACPFTVFVAPAYADGQGELWWSLLEEVIAHNGRVRPALPGLPEEMRCESDDEKMAVWHALYPAVRWQLGEHEQRRWIRDFCARHGVDWQEHCQKEVMDWQALKALAAEPLCSIGAHTVHHHALARLPDAEEVRQEMETSRARIRQELGIEANTLAYPYGDAGSADVREFELAAQAGFSIALTTRKGLLQPEHALAPTAVPRLSLNGFYQNIRYLDVLLTGAPFALAGRLAG